MDELNSEIKEFNKRKRDYDERKKDMKKKYLMIESEISQNNTKKKLMKDIFKGYDDVEKRLDEMEQKLEKDIKKINKSNLWKVSRWNKTKIIKDRIITYFLWMIF